MAISNYRLTPGDFQSVEFGIKLYETYHSGLTLDKFQSFLTAYGWMLQKADEIPEWSWPNLKTTDPWPYRVGHFDGPETQANAPVVRLLLGGTGE